MQCSIRRSAVWSLLDNVAEASPTMPRAASQSLAMTTKGTDVRRLEGWTACYEGRDRAELSDALFLKDKAVSLGQESATPDSTGRLPGSEHGNEPGKGYSQSLRQDADVIYVNLGTLCSYLGNEIRVPEPNAVQGAEPP
jgi:hypothetical protein